jgi:hypothetical protein
MLLSRLLPDDGLKVAHHHRIGVGAGHGTDHIVGIADVSDPISERLVHRIFEGLAAGLHDPDLGAKEFHAQDIERLPFHIFLSHEDLTLQTKLGGHGRRGHPMLARPGLRDDPSFFHSARE